MQASMANDAEGDEGPSKALGWVTEQLQGVGGKYECNYLKREACR